MPLFPEPPTRIVRRGMPRETGEKGAGVRPRRLPIRCSPYAPNELDHPTLPLYSSIRQSPRRPSGPSSVVVRHDADRQRTDLIGAVETAVPMSPLTPKRCATAAQAVPLTASRPGTVPGRIVADTQAKTAQLQGHGAATAAAGGGDAIARLDAPPHRFETLVVPLDRGAFEDEPSPAASGRPSASASPSRRRSAADASATASPSVAPERHAASGSANCSPRAAANHLPPIFSPGKRPVGRGLTVRYTKQ